MELKSWLKQCPLVAILRGVRPPEVEAIGTALADAGVRIIEVPLNSPAPLDSIWRLARALGNRVLIGAGTVTTEEQVAYVAEAEGKLVVTPHADTVIISKAKQRGLFVIAGYFTPTEAFAALAAGADALKLFPAMAASPTALRALRAVLPPGTMVLPVGGIEARNLRTWQDAGAAGFGVGSSIYRPGNDAQRVAEKARVLVAALGG